MDDKQRETGRRNLGGQLPSRTNFGHRVTYGLIDLRDPHLGTLKSKIIKGVHWTHVQLLTLGDIMSIERIYPHDTHISCIRMGHGFPEILSVRIFLTSDTVMDLSTSP